MGWLEFIEKIVSHLAWPGTTIAILWIVRRHLGGIFAGLKSLKLPGGVELELHDRFKELREQAQAAQLPIPEAPITEAADDEHAKFLRMAEDFPQAAIMQCWIQLEKDISEVAAAHARPTIPHTYRPRSLVGAMRELQQSELLDSATVEVIDHLRRIRNEVVHARREAVTPGEALEFRELAMAVSAKLRDIGR